MIRTLLIANRGEIACRIARTARGLGIATIAVHSDADAGAAHVAACDRAVRIGGAAPADSYLRGDAVIAAARATGADAIHPGYGFLSENPDFVEAVDAAGLTFVGPSAAAIRTMGLKDAAKEAMEAAGVPVVPGYRGLDQADGRLAAEAARIGWPVLIKAVAGGGGKGMRRVDAEADFAEALAAARAEARGAFGNDRVLIERYVATPRHIEVQVFGDGTRALHLHERDCSLQRRHQKVIEEAPAPGMTPEMRAAMGAAAVRAAEAIGYAGAGTVEFIVDASDGLRPDRFYFMEMNTRLQVEHPVTEAVRGIDLVAWQLAVAGGAPLPMTQGEIPLRGHAIEARLYAEDVPTGFLPATGRLAHLAFPDGVRVDAGVRAGDEIGPHYDPMIAKLIVHAPDRDAALAVMTRALEGTEVAGLTTNLGFLGRLVRHPGFAAGQVDTGLIERDAGTLVPDPAPTEPQRVAAARAALGPRGDGFTLWAPLRHRVVLGHDGETSEHWVSVARGATTVDGAPAPDLRALRHGDAVTVFGPAPVRFDLPRPGRDASPPDAGSTLAPMPGRITRIAVAPGEAVAVGQ
ncbi:MAG: ATP-binding protein, partial [Shimia sp.]